MCSVRIIRININYFPMHSIYYLSSYNRDCVFTVRYELDVYIQFRLLLFQSM